MLLEQTIYLVYGEDERLVYLRENLAHLDKG